MNLRTYLLLLLFFLITTTLAVAQPLKEAREIADLQYKAATAADREGWVKYFTAGPRREFQDLIARNEHGCELELVWLASQRSRERGVTYEYFSGEMINDQKIKLIYQPYLKNGRKTTATVPVFLELETDGWRIKNLRYH